MENIQEEIYKKHKIEIWLDDSSGIWDWNEFTNDKRQDKKEDFYFLTWHRNIGLSKRWGDPENALQWANGNKYWALPVYLYEHSGRAWSIKPFSCPWDSGQAGYVLIKKTIARTQKKALQIATFYIDELNHVECGEVYGYNTYSPDGEELDCCGGFIGDLKYCLDEAKSSIDYAIKEQEKEMLPGITLESLLENKLLVVSNKY